MLMPPCLYAMEAPLPDLSQNDRNVIFDGLNISLNCIILQSLVHGLYTGIIAVTLRVISSSPKKLCTTFLHIIIITLYVLSTIEFAIDWVFKRRAFIGHGNNYYTVFTALADNGPWWRAYNIIGSVAGGTTTLLVDITIIWRCWILWNRQWRVIFVPMVFAVAGTAMKAMEIFSTFRESTNPDISGTSHFVTEINWPLIYILLTLSTTLTCTILIVYRLIRHAPGMSTSHKLIEMLIESSAMYSLSLIVYLALLVQKNSHPAFYIDIIAAYIKAIAPTLLVGRVSAHAKATYRREKMVAMWENHPPLVGCFREGDTDYNHPDDGH
ncbi:uncharacterized protein BT62DRAFT_1081291 [Guyanagaster necrorhizus]|uniref:Uncharacterized protein n=1 Tax=Guyanagaster necrorhizus TaxID=856835 RepID=A0A9P7VFB1_9AGAR|nr:uncharacterized protein BT62DRAFT_1081291 [Guyanagaster necrorhizus MCA 3950]KAG7439906.1 hypothetical protein BT62DRAFT_1081291 [Guyanagaster necrorhizus MCA 3950]